METCSLCITAQHEVVLLYSMAEKTIGISQTTRNIRMLLRAERKTDNYIPTRKSVWKREKLYRKDTRFILMLLTLILQILIQ